MTSPQSVPKPFPMGRREFVFLMASLQSMQALAIDAMLPALGTIASELGAQQENHRQLVVSVYLMGTGLGSLLPGSLADRFGRRPVLFTCLAFYTVCCFACALVTDFTTLLVLRGLQAVVCAGLAVLPPAIVRDRFEGDHMARVQSLIMVVFLTVPMLAPALGQAILYVADWRWIFGAMGIQSALILTWTIIRLPETLPAEGRHPIRIASIATGMVRIATTRGSIGYVLASTLVMSGIWGYINSSQQLIAVGFGAEEEFPYVFGAVVAGMVLASFVNSRIVDRFGARRVSHSAIFAFIAAAALQVTLAFHPGQTLWQFASVMCVNMALLGFLGANFSSIALQPFGKNAGAASSVQAFVRMVFAALLGAMIGQAYDGTPRPLALALLIAGILALLLVLFSERGRLFRRINPPGTVREQDGVVR